MTSGQSPIHVIEGFSMGIRTDSVDVSLTFFLLFFSVSRPFVSHFLHNVCQKTRQLHSFRACDTLCYRDLLFISLIFECCGRGLSLARRASSREGNQPPTLTMRVSTKRCNHSFTAKSSKYLFPSNSRIGVLIFLKSQESLVVQKRRTSPLLTSRLSFYHSPCTPNTAQV